MSEGHSVELMLGTDKGKRVWICGRVNTRTQEHSRTSSQMGSFPSAKRICLSNSWLKGEQLSLVQLPQTRRDLLTSPNLCKAFEGPDGRLWVEGGF